MSIKAAVSALKSDQEAGFVRGESESGEAVQQGTRDVTEYIEIIRNQELIFNYYTCNIYCKKRTVIPSSGILFSRNTILPFLVIFRS